MISRTVSNAKRVSGYFIVRCSCFLVDQSSVGPALFTLSDHSHGDENGTPGLPEMTPPKRASSSHRDTGRGQKNRVPSCDLCCHRSRPFCVVRNGSCNGCILDRHRNPHEECTDKAVVGCQYNSPVGRFGPPQAATFDHCVDLPSHPKSLRRHSCGLAAAGREHRACTCEHALRNERPDDDLLVRSRRLHGSHSPWQQS